MDLSSGYDVPNAYGLQASDFDHDMDSYRAALGFLGDLSSGSEEQEALRANGGNPGLLVAWEGIRKFRKVIGKARQAGQAEREHEAHKREDAADVFRTPPRRGFWDPFHRGQRAPDASPAYLAAFKQAASAMAAVNAQEGPAPVGGQRFTRFEDLSPQQVAEANAQHAPQTQAQPAPGDVWAQFANTSSASFPWPTGSDGRPLPAQRGEVSLIPGVKPINVKPGDE